MILETLAGLAGAAAGLMVRSEYEKRHFTTEQYTITSDKLGDREYHFVFLSDLHNNEFGSGNQALLNAIDKISPQAVLIGGDMVVAKGLGDISEALRLTERLASRYPVYYGNGNHEQRMDEKRERFGDLYDRFAARLRACGVHHLSDQSVQFDDYIRISAANLTEKYYRHHFTVPKLPVEELNQRLGESDGTCFELLLFHSPLFFNTCRRWGADLTLSGHFHGGTIRLPFLGGVMTPQYQFFVPWCAGRFDAEGKTMVVSRGLGTHSINIRLNNRPHLVWLTLTGKRQTSLLYTGSGF